METSYGLVKPRFAGNALSVPLPEAKSKLSELIDRIRRGEEFIITRHDTTIARLVPAQRPSRVDLADAITKMRAGRSQRRASTRESRSMASREISLLEMPRSLLAATSCRSRESGILSVRGAK